MATTANTVSKVMTGITPNAAFAGVSLTDNFLLAIDCTEDGSATAVKDYTVIQTGITGVDAQIETETDDKTYIRSGKVTVKSSVQRTFSVTGDRYHGDAFQDFALSAAIKFGTGAAVVRKYVYFSMLTGVGETGSVAIIVNSDGSGDAGSTAEIDIDLRAVGVPEAYTYSAT